MKKETGLQKDLFGQTVHILNSKEIYRMVKCGRCGSSVKSSKAKTHLSFGKALTICKDCLEKGEKYNSGKKKRDENRMYDESIK